MERKVSEIDPQWLKRQLEGGKTYADIARFLGISREWVRQYCKKHEISFKRTAPWYAKRYGIPQLENPEWLLSQKKEQVGIERLVRELGISSRTLKRQIIRLGLNPKEFQITGKKITLKCSVCGKVFERKLSQLKKNKHNFCNRSCLGKWMIIKRGWGRIWTPEEKEFVRNNWQKMSDSEIAKCLDRTLTAVRAYRKRELCIKSF